MTPENGRVSVVRNEESVTYPPARSSRLSHKVLNKPRHVRRSCAGLKFELTNFQPRVRNGRREATHLEPTDAVGEMPRPDRSKQQRCDGRLTSLYRVLPLMDNEEQPSNRVDVTLPFGVGKCGQTMKPQKI
jgi:hypothetical protein